LGDGLWAWYGADVSKIDPLLRAPETTLNAHQVRMRAQGYRQALPLLLALRSPHVYLIEDPKSAGTPDGPLPSRALAERGIVSPRLRDLALEQTLTPLRRVPRSPLKTSP
jgi:hypothetical protein